MAAAEERRANQLIYDAIAVLGIFTGTLMLGMVWRNLRRLTPSLDDDFKYGVLRIMCRRIAERRLNAPLQGTLFVTGSSAYQHAVDIVNGIYVHEHRKYHEAPVEFVFFL